MKEQKTIKDYLDRDVHVCVSEEDINYFCLDGCMSIWETQQQLIDGVDLDVVDRKHVYTCPKEISSPNIIAMCL